MENEMQTNWQLESKALNLRVEIYGTKGHVEQEIYLALNGRKTGSARVKNCLTGARYKVKVGCGETPARWQADY